MKTDKDNPKTQLTTLGKQDIQNNKTQHNSENKKRMNPTKPTKIDGEPRCS